jgi:hypothetical protein
MPATVQARAGGGQGESEQLDWQVRCQALSQEYVACGQVEIPVRRLQSSDLDDWFEELK